MKEKLIIGITLMFAPLTFFAQQTKMNDFIDDLMQKMTLDEKIGQLNLLTSFGAVTGDKMSEDVEGKLKSGQIGGMFNILNPVSAREMQEIAVTKTRSKIPLIFGMDVIHGYETIFPIPLGLSSSWDTDLIERTAKEAAKEATSRGVNWNFSPMTDISRDPRWGRVSEGSGEDPFLGAAIAKAMVRGYQGDDLADAETLMACVKHFALYGAPEGGRDYNSVDMSRHQMYQYYFAPYKAAVDAGVGSIMTAFNIVDGIPSTGNKWLLTEVLRKQWNFGGFVVTDYTSIAEMEAHGLGNLQTVSAMALNAGVDMDMMSEGFTKTLKKSLAEGKVTEQEIDKACRYILEAKYKLGLFDDPYRYLPKQQKNFPNAGSRALALEAAKKSFVLLKNENQTLPLSKNKTIALIGPLADNQREMLGTWVITGKAEDAITVKKGFENHISNKSNLLYAKGANITNDDEMIKRLNYFGQEFVKKDTRSPEEMLNEAVETAKKSDVIIAVLGETHAMNGEAASRTDLNIPEAQQKLLKALKKTGKPIVLVVFSGRPLTLNWEKENCDAILAVWAGGTEAGNAVAETIFGDYNPSGKLTMTFPRNVGQIPIYYNHLNTGRPYKEGDPQTKFKSNYLDESNLPLYPFGYGLSYTTFKYSPVTVSTSELKGENTLLAEVTVTNAGKYAGEETVQLYIGDPVATVSRSLKELKGFQKIQLTSGESKTVRFEITPELLKFYNSNLEYDWEEGEFILYIGSDSSTTNRASVFWNK